MRRYYYKKPYQVPKSQKPAKKKSQPILQPEWDDTIHDLSQLKLSPEEQLRRRLSRISHNQLGVAVVSNQPRHSGAASLRYSQSDASATDDGQESDSGSCNAEQCQQQRSSTKHRYDQQQHQGQASISLSRSAAAQDQPSSDDNSDDADDDDVCQWHGVSSSPLQQRHSQPQPSLQHERRHRSGGVARHTCPSKQQQVQDADAAAVHVQDDGSLMVEAGVLQVLLDKIDALEQQLRHQHNGSQQQHCENEPQHDLCQQLASSQQQLADTQQQLDKLQEEHRQYVDHTSSLLTRLQTQLQQLMTQAPNLLLGEAGSGNSEHQRVCSRQEAAAWQQTPSSSSPVQCPHRSSTPMQPTSAAAGLGPIGLRASSSSATRSPSKLLLRPASAVSVTVLPVRPTSTDPVSRTATAAQRAASSGPAAANATAAQTSSRLGSAAVQVAEAAALPSYAAMRQRRSVAGGAAAAWPGASYAAGSAEAGVAGSSSSSAGVPKLALDQHSMSHAALFSRPVPAPIAAPMDTVFAAIIPGQTASLQQQQPCVPGSWCNADQVAPVISAHSRSPLSQLAPDLAADTADALSGLDDVGWGLCGGLPRAAVNRVYSVAGVTEAVELPPRPRVLLGQLAGNVSLLDHLKAAKTAAETAATSKRGQENKEYVY